MGLQHIQDLYLFFRYLESTDRDIFFREIRELIHVDNYLKFVEWEKYLYQFEVHRLFLFLKFHSKLQVRCLLRCQKIMDVHLRVNRHRT